MWLLSMCSEGVLWNWASAVSLWCRTTRFLLLHWWPRCLPFPSEALAGFRMVHTSLALEELVFCSLLCSMHACWCQEIEMLLTCRIILLLDVVCLCLLLNSRKNDWLDSFLWWFECQISLLFILASYDTMALSKFFFSLHHKFSWF